MKVDLPAIGCGGRNSWRNRGFYPHRRITQNARAWR
jgi:hypothetical protein